MSEAVRHRDRNSRRRAKNDLRRFVLPVANRKIPSYLVHLSPLWVSYMSAALLGFTGERIRRSVPIARTRISTSVVISKRNIKRRNFGIWINMQGAVRRVVAQSSDAGEEGEINWYYNTLLSITMGNRLYGRDLNSISKSLFIFWVNCSQTLFCPYLNSPLPRDTTSAEITAPEWMKESSIFRDTRRFVETAWPSEKPFYLWSRAIPTDAPGAPRDGICSS